MNFQMNLLFNKLIIFLLQFSIKSLNSIPLSSPSSLFWPFNYFILHLQKEDTGKQDQILDYLNCALREEKIQTPILYSPNGKLGTFLCQKALCVPRGGLGWGGAGGGEGAGGGGEKESFL